MQASHRRNALSALLQKFLGDKVMRAGCHEIMIAQRVWYVLRSVALHVVEDFLP